MSNKSSPSHESNLVPSSSRSTLLTDETISRDFSLASLASASTISQQDEYFHCENHASTALHNMQSYLDSQQLCDVILISGVDKKRVPAHRIVLSASSAYFAAMFMGSLRESKQEEITLVDVHGEPLQLLVQYCYTGTIELREDNVEVLLATACLLQLSPVVNACCNFLAKQLHPSNCLGFALFAEQQSCHTLYKLSTSYTSQHFMQVCKNQEFYQLNADQLATLLKSDDLNVPTEQDVFHALMAWVQHDFETREKYIPELLGLVRLPLLQPTFIADYVESLCASKECQQLVMEALKWHLMPERRAQISSDRTRPRKSTVGRLLAIGGLETHRDTYRGALSSSIESFCPRLDKWTILKHPTTGRRLQFGVVLMDDKLIICGGRDGLKTLNSVDCLDLNSMTYTSLGSMTTHRHGLGVVILGGPLYAVGGHDGWSYLNTVERWDPIARTWSSVAAMSFMRSTAGVAVLNNRLYVCGGRDGSSCHQSVECYDPHTNKWTLRSPMNRRRSGVAVVVLNGFLYALGGHDSPASNPSVCRTETVERYDPATDTWTMIASLSSGRDSIGAAILGDNIFAVGGYDGNGYLDTVEKYDAEKNEWIQMAPLNCKRAALCVVAVPNILKTTVATTV